MPFFRCLGLALLVASAMAGPASAKVPAKLKSGLVSPSEKVRIIAVAAIAKTGDAEAAGLIRGMLADKAPTVRAAAVDGLVALQDASAMADIAALQKDPDETVRAVAERGVKALSAFVVAVDTGEVLDASGRNYPGVTERLQKGFETELKKLLPPDVVVKRGGVEKGYGALLKIRSITNGSDGANGYVEVTCDMTLVELPGKILRLSSKASAAAGVEGTLPPAMEPELTNDGIDACAPSLAKDFADYVEQRRRR